MKILEVRWQDAEGGFGEWTPQSEIMDWVMNNRPIIISVGYLLYRDDSYISLVQNIDQKSKECDCGHCEDAFSNIMRIPVPMVVGERELTGTNE